MTKPTQLTEITTIHDIQQLALSGFTNWQHYGDVNVIQRGSLLLFDYTTAAHIANRWNFFERISRGLIINRHTGEIVARPFDKFFYWLSSPFRTRGHIVTVTEKLDGSLGILFRHKGAYLVTTKGSFFSPQARWATRHLSQHHDLTGLPDELTLLFEVVYPENRIVVDYEQRAELVLLAARNRFTGDFLPFFPDVYELAQRYHFALPQVYQFNSVDDVIAHTDGKDRNFEGWVVEFSDGQRFKFKTDWYVEIHKLLQKLDFKNILKAVANEDVAYLLETIPAPLLGDARQWIDDIRAKVARLKAQTEAAFVLAPRDSHEMFMAWLATQDAEIQPYLSALYAGQSLEAAIYQHAFTDQLAHMPAAVEIPVEW
jgi:RNA ligase